MEQKRVSFEVAKAIKEAGYPQVEACCAKAYTEDGTICLTQDFDPPVRPTYLDVWLWLWRENKIHIPISAIFKKVEYSFEITDGARTAIPIGDNDGKDFYGSDPEEIIIAAIEYLVEKNLIK